MDRERVEEFLLVGVGLGMISYLVSGTIGQKILITVLLALGLIMVLLLRGLDWRAEGSNPYDWVLLTGIFITLIHLFSFSAFSPGMLGTILLVLFGAFYFGMAILLYRHRWLFRRHN